MISIIITKISLRMNKVFLLGILLTAVFLILSLLGIFPYINSSDSYSELLKQMPQELMVAFGKQGDASKITDFLVMNFYNSLYLYILMVYVVVFSSRLSAKLLGETAMVYFLNSSISRKKFLTSQIMVFNLGLGLITICSVLSAMLGKVFFPDKEFDMPGLLKINVQIMALFILTGAICFLINALVNNAGQAVGYSTLLVVLFYITDIFRKLSTDLKWLEYFTLFSLYDPKKISEDNGYVLTSSIAMLAAAIVVYLGTVWHFNRRDLYL